MAQDRRLVNIWNSMIQRCNNPRSASYSKYGAKGIRVCDRWMSYELWYEDIGQYQVTGLDMDRIDNNGDYSPENVRLVASKINQRNRSNIIMHEGEPLVQVCERLGLRYGTVRQRIYVYGWSIEKALKTTIRKRG